MDKIIDFIMSKPWALFAIMLGIVDIWFWDWKFYVIMLSAIGANWLDSKNE